MCLVVVPGHSYCQNLVVLMEFGVSWWGTASQTEYLKLTGSPFVYILLFVYRLHPHLRSKLCDTPKTVDSSLSVCSRAVELKVS